MFDLKVLQLLTMKNIFWGFDVVYLVEINVRFLYSLRFAGSLHGLTLRL
jgi:hypothetical protein